MHGLCNAYLSKNPGQREKALRAPGFARLVSAAGGVDRVEEFCSTPTPPGHAARDRGATGPGTGGADNG
ncbi:hypothetical protein AWW66_30655 [Micromonospora rosaria]|uniref:Uncharacterized protein n=1 Tax=Micromonospora rosaria TaxID=47874 RepID=A0A136PIQ1_9ACTN|nr:hypothetical protein AWW66_30655 [Micromonospora rosaria]